MDTKAPNLIPSGIEPVDKLMGGLQSGQSYLVHGEASGKSLFGIKFLIEGLKRGENGALVIRYSPEDAVRRFARLGYDCLEDVYSGRLVILEYSDDIIQQISRLRELTPVLRELEWLLGETRPQRIIFDPFTSLVAGEGSIQFRVREFTDWARSFGATVIYIANGNGEVVEAIKPHAADVFRFEVKEIADRAMRFISFEKSSAIPDQAIEVDPSRGIFLLERARNHEQFFSMFQGMPSIAVSGAASEASPSTQQPADRESIVEESNETEQASSGLAKTNEPAAIEPPSDKPHASETSANQRLAFPEIVSDNDSVKSKENPPEIPAALKEWRTHATTRFSRITETGTHQPPAQTAELAPDDLPLTDNPQPDIFSDLADELTNSSSPLDLDLFETEPVAAPVADQTPQASTAATEQAAEAVEPVASVESGAESSQTIEPSEPSQATEPSGIQAHQPAPSSQRKHSRASDQKLDSLMAQRAAEILLRPPDADAEPAPAAKTERKAAPMDENAASGVQTKAFNALIIQDDPVTREVIAHTLSDYTIEMVNDGVSGLAKLISMKPDLVVLDLDLPIIDGFKVLEHIRSSLNMPIIIVSGSRVRATDRVRAAELGADYYLTKPFSVIELRHKARQLIARYHGIDSWILTSARASQERGQQAESETVKTALSEPLVLTIGPEGEQFVQYQDFESRVEDRVKTAMDKDSAFSIVGCRLAQMTANGGQPALRLFELVRELVRDTDLISTNQRNDLVILLTDANAGGAHAFVGRLRERVLNDLNQEPSVWLRSFPDLEEDTEATAAAPSYSNGNNGRRRLTDKATEAGSATVERRAGSAQQRTGSTGAPADSDPRKPYIDFLEQL